MELDSSDGLNIVNILKLSNLYILKCLKWSILCYVNCILKKKKAVSTRNLTVASDRISFLKWIYWLIKRGFFFFKFNYTVSGMDGSRCSSNFFRLEGSTSGIWFLLYWLHFQAG